MLKLLFALPLVFLAACGDPDWDPVAATDFATTRANEVHSIGQKIRDRCNQTQDLDDCRDWLDYQREIEVDWGISSYPYYLEEWERKGPY